MRALKFITGHVIYNPAYTYKFQLKTTIGIGFGTGVITLSFSIFDITSDGLVAKSFLWGTDYIKDVKNQSDLVVTNNQTNCTLIGHNVFHSTIENAEKIEDFYRYIVTLDRYFSNLFL